MPTTAAPVSGAGLWLAASRLAGPLRRVPATTRVAYPVVLVAVVLALILGARLVASHGNPTGFIQFGRQFAAHTHPPAGALIQSRYGYDGQFYWLQATDPLLRHVATRADLDATGRGYELQRMGYPALAYALAAGQRGALPWTLLAVNVAAILLLTAAVARFARAQGRSVWWGLAAGLTPGIIMGTLRDLSDPLATAALVGGLVAYARGRHRWAAALLALAVLTREPMVVGVAAVAADALVGLWRSRAVPAERRRAMRAWPAIVVPAVLFLAWHLYISGLTVPAPRGAAAAAPTAPAGEVAATAKAAASSDTLALPPTSDLRAELQHSLTHDAAGPAAWELLYVALLAAATLSALTLLRRGLRAATVTALLSAAVITVIFVGDQWGVSRYGAPLFGPLLVAGLQLRSRSALAVCGLAAVLTIAIPVVIPGG